MANNTELFEELMQLLMADPIVPTSTGKLCDTGRLSASVAAPPQLGVDVCGELPDPNFIPAFSMRRRGNRLTYVVGALRSGFDPVPKVPVPFSARLPIPLSAPIADLWAKVQSKAGTVLFEGPLPAADSAGV